MGWGSAGKTVRWFYGNRVDTVFDGTLDLAGTLQIGNDWLAFAVSVTSYGGGGSDTVTLAAALWIVFQTDGLLDSGEPIALHGAIYILGEESNLTTLSLGAGVGTSFLRADSPDGTHWISGTLPTTASGAFVPVDDPGTMQIVGTRAFTINGQLLEVSDELTEQLPWDPISWPLEYHEALLALLLNVKADEERMRKRISLWNALIQQGAYSSLVTFRSEPYDRCEIRLWVGKEIR